MINIISIDKIKEKSIKDTIDIYLIRVKNKLKINIIEIPPAKYHLFNEIDKAIKYENDKIMNTPLLKNKDLLIFPLDETGTQFSSIDFSNLIYNNLNKITFIIGGTYGLSNELKNISGNKLSLSKMTLTKEMTRLILIEQIYRAFTIYENIKYHKI